MFLAPVILAMNWGTPRQTAGTTAVYNLMNSGAALIGAHAWWDQIPPALPWWLAAVAAGGSMGPSPEADTSPIAGFAGSWRSSGHVGT